MRRAMAVAAIAGVLATAAPAEAQEAKAPRPWRRHLARHMTRPVKNTPIEVRALLNKRRDRIRAGWEKWRRDYETHQDYLAALAAASEVQAASSFPYASAGGSLEAIRDCESGGDYSAVSSSGTYRGAYQFDAQTWASVGGSGDPAAASPQEQDMRAQMLMEQRGTSPWPVCGN